MATDQRQVIKYSFFALDPAFRRLPEVERMAGARELMNAIGAEVKGLTWMRTYGLLGTRGDAQILLWTASEHIQAVEGLVENVYASGMGRYLTMPYSYLAMTRRSIYVERRQHEGQEGTRLTRTPGNAPYLFVYPFVKTRAWFRLPMEERQRMMDEHIQIGHKYPTVRIHTSYSFGLDDQEFMVAFEARNPGDFLDLVEDLRGSEASAYTLRDTPIFSCVARDIESIVHSLAR